MPTKKDSHDAEEQYFLKRDKEMIKERRRELDLKRKEEDKQRQMQTHWMKCPKCGSSLEEESHNNVMIDRCTECKGIWLDAGELELLTRGQEEQGGGFLSKLFK